MKSERDIEEPGASADIAEPTSAEVRPDELDQKARESTLPLDIPRLDEVSEVELSEPESQRHRRRAIVEHYRQRPHRSAMLRVTGRLLRLIGAILFTHVHFGQQNRDNLKDVAARATPIYVMQSRSFLDYLYFNYLFLNQELPLAQFANGINTNWFRGPLSWLKRLFVRNPTEPPEIQAQALVEHDEAIFLFLERPRKSAQENIEFSQKFLTRLIHAERHSQRPLVVVPMLLVWEKRPDPKRIGLLEEFFGTAQRPGFWRKFLSFFQTFWQSFFKIGQPLVQISTTLNLGEFLREYPNAGSADASELLRARLVDYLERERSVILGPTGESPEVLYRDILNRPALLAAIREVAAEEGVSEEEVRERARAQFQEIAAAPSPLMLKIWSSLLSVVWYRIYAGFDLDLEGLEQVRKAARESSLVLIPSHKSHVDYLVMSYVMYNYGMVPPLVAAGVNLSFWPMGPLFRWAGGFFIRRSFRGEKLYPVVFREYLIRQMEEGYPIEFFIEGTRSRTGKLIKPKYGMLEMIIGAYTSGRIDSLKIVPISVGYEKIIEERSYRQELLGAEKEKESLGGLLKTPKILTSKYGRLYIEFGEPIDLGEYLDLYEVDRLRPDSEALDALTVRLAHRVIYDINHVATVSPTALLALVLLAGMPQRREQREEKADIEERGICRELLLKEIGFALSFLTRRAEPARLSGVLRESIDELREDAAWSDDLPGARWPTTAELRANELADPQTSTRGRLLGRAVATIIDEAIGLFEQNKQIRVQQDGEQTYYLVPEESRPELAYYRNNIIHYFVPQALLAAAIGKFRRAEIPLEELMEETRFLSRLFKYEWIYEERAKFETVFLRTLAGFESQGWLAVSEVELDALLGAEAVTLKMVQGGLVQLAEPARGELEFFSHLVLSFLEAYALVAEVVAESEGVWERDALVKQAIKKARGFHATGELSYYESLSKPTFKNTVRLLEDWEMIERQPSTKKGHSLDYKVSAETSAADFLALRDRLRAFLS